MKTAGRRAEPKEEAGRELMDMDGAIALLKTTRPTFYRWLRTGKFKGMKVGRQWRFYKEDIERFLTGEGPRIDLPGTLKPLLAVLEKRLAEAGRPLKAPLTGPEDLQAAMLTILAAKHLGASVVHLDPQKKDGSPEPVAVLRFRIDGVLHPIAEFDLALLKPVLMRWKIMANVNIHEARVPQDGRIQLNVGEKPLDMRISLVPACLGEAMTARILDASSVALSLGNIAYAPRDKERLLRFLDSPWGMLLIVGPAGCGKTTALYACLNRCIRPGNKVMSVEDPVEYLLPGVTQIPVRPEQGVSFLTAMRALLRCDPDVIMIGEMRDQQSLALAQYMALTGHLVMTTLHTDNAAAALQRMADMGTDPFVIADATKLIVAQRLVRKLCPACSREEKLASVTLDRAKAMAAAGGVAWESLPRTFRAAVGCASCRQTGFFGRTVIAEALEVTPAIGVALRNHAPVEELQALAVKQGMTTMAADGIRRAAAGETTIDEVFRVIGTMG